MSASQKKIARVTLEEFLQKLARKTKRQKAKWTPWQNGFALRSNDQLCPIAFVWGGSSGGANETGVKHGLTSAQAGQIMDAADLPCARLRPALCKIRKQLLKAVGLDELLA